MKDTLEAVDNFHAAWDRFVRTLRCCIALWMHDKASTILLNDAKDKADKIVICANMMKFISLTEKVYPNRGE